MLTKPLMKFSSNLCELKGGWCNHAILYKDDKIAKFIANSKVGIIDSFMVNAVQKKFNCFTVIPMTATQYNSKSNIAKGKTDYRFKMRSSYRKYAL